MCGILEAILAKETGLDQFTLRIRLFRLLGLVVVMLLFSLYSPATTLAVSVFVFLYFLWRIFPTDRALALFLCFLVFLCFLRFDVFRYRPYWDSIFGAFAQAIYLLENNFDLVSLLKEEPFVDVGGPKVYIISIFPFYLALLMKAFSDPEQFLYIVHLMGFVYASIALTVFFKILRLSFDRELSVFGVILLLAQPLFLSQADAIYMEIWLMMFSLLGLYAFLRERIIIASIFSLLTLLSKETGVIFSIALYITYVLTGTKNHRVSVCHGILLVIPILFGALAYMAMPFRAKLGIFIGASGFVSMVWRWLPVVFVLSIVLCFFGVYLFFSLYLRLFGSLTSARLIEQIKRIFIMARSIKPVQLFVFVFLITFFGFHMQVTYFLPRYVLFAYPFLIFGLLSLLCRVFHMRFSKLTVILCGLLLTFFITRHAKTNGHLFEATLAYEDDLKFYTSLAAHLEQHYKDKWIVTSWPLVQMITLPRLGYVKEPLKAISVGTPCLYCPSLTLEEVEKTFDWSQAVLVISPTAPRKGLRDIEGEVVEQFRGFRTVHILRVLNPDLAAIVERTV